MNARKSGELRNHGFDSLRNLTWVPLFPWQMKLPKLPLIHCFDVSNSSSLPTFNQAPYEWGSGCRRWSVDWSAPHFRGKNVKSVTICWTCFGKVQHWTWHFRKMYTGLDDLTIVPGSKPQRKLIASEYPDQSVDRWGHCTRFCQKIVRPHWTLTVPTYLSWIVINRNALSMDKWWCILNIGRP